MIALWLPMDPRRTPLFEAIADEAKEYSWRKLFVSFGPGEETTRGTQTCGIPEAGVRRDSLESLFTHASTKAVSEHKSTRAWGKSKKDCAKIFFIRAKS